VLGGEQMKEAREKKLMSQAELSRRLGVSRAYYNQIESGKRIPGIDLKRKINEQLETKIF